MAIFQCEHCGCAENTAMTSMAVKIYPQQYDWTGIEDRKGKRLCSACCPSHTNRGERMEELGQWHGRFERVFLPKGQFRTNKVGNLEHTATGDTNIRKYRIYPDEYLSEKHNG